MRIEGLTPGLNVGVWGVLREDDTIALTSREIFRDYATGPVMKIVPTTYDWILIRVRGSPYKPFEIVVPAAEQVVEVEMREDFIFEPWPWWSQLWCKHAYGEWSVPKRYKWTWLFGMEFVSSFTWRACQVCGKLQERRVKHG